VSATPFASGSWTAPPSPANDSAEKTSGNFYLQSLLPALLRLDSLLEWAVSAMHSVPWPSSSWRGLYIDEAEVKRLLAQTPTTSPFQRQCAGGQDSRAELAGAPLTGLIQRFGLSAFDADLLILAAASELDLRYERIYAYLQDDITRKHPTVELALNLLCSSADEKLERRAHLGPEAPLIRDGLLQLLPDPNQVAPPFLAHYLKVQPQIIRFLLGLPGLDPQFAAFCRLSQPASQCDCSRFFPEELGAVLPVLLEQSVTDGEPLRLYFRGAPGTGKRSAAEALAARTGRTLLSCDLSRMSDCSEFGNRLNWVLREAALRDCILYLCGLDGLCADGHAHRQTLLQTLAGYAGPLILSGTQPWAGGSFAVIAVEFGVLDFDQRRAWWQTQIARVGLPLHDDELDALASRFRLTAAQIEESVSGARRSAQWRSAKSPTPSNQAVLSLEDLYAAARAKCGHDLARHARKIEAHYTWDDIALPPDQIAQLREICYQAEYRHRVYDSWGFDRKLTLGKGLNVLFFGPPGTGKTMAAEVVASELRLDLYRIDLSQVISKYIGETEKNLDQIFTAAENSNAILFFDEADALFGKRSEVRDAHDRYANIEISYLLQKMEEYQGISILATNLRQNLDEAFVRRLQAIVEFPFPDEEYRQRIWRLAFPPEAPLDDDVQFDLLAREIRLAGGNVKNMALAAAFYAAAESQTIHMSHLVQAAKREHQKLGRSWNDAAFRQTAPAST